MVQTAPVTPGKDYTVVSGDSLWVIAVRAYGSGTEWPKIYQANLQTIGKNPDLIFPGQVLHIPPVTASAPPQPDLHLRVSTEIQGDVLAGLNKDYRLYLFLSFPDQDNGRAWLKDLIPYIANTKDVAAFNSLFSLARRATGGKDPVNLKATWVNVSLTFAGLKLLLNADPTDSLSARFPSFVKGPADDQVAGLNGDLDLSAPENWVVGRKDQIIHALLNIQSDNPDDLAAEVQKLKAIGAQYGVTVVFGQDGATLTGNLKGHEHFGFKDGISQPGVKNFDLSDPNDPVKDPTAVLGHVLGDPGTEIIAAGEFILGEQDENKQTFSVPELQWMQTGSFQVFRRLNQDVPSFDKQEDDNLKGLSPDDPLRGELGAKLVGRWKSGTPIDLSPDKNSNPADNSNNNFDYINGQPKADLEGFRAPRFAHIRKVYPRQQNFAGNRTRRIIRRGVPFGLAFDPEGGPGQGANAERGLVFVAYMSSIEDKFEFLMGAWVNNPAFPVADAGPDPIIGTSKPPVANTMHRDGGRPNFEKVFQRFIQTTGTLYAFVPSISTLKGLANGTL